MPKSKTITLNELYAVMGLFGLNFSAAYDMLKAIDTNGDHVIDFHEFYHHWATKMLWKFSFNCFIQVVKVRQHKERGTFYRRDTLLRTQLLKSYSGSRVSLKDEDTDRGNANGSTIRSQKALSTPTAAAACIQASSEPVVKPEQLFSSTEIAPVTGVTPLTIHVVSSGQLVPEPDDNKRAGPKLVPNVAPAISSGSLNPETRPKAGNVEMFQRNQGKGNGSDHVGVSIPLSSVPSVGLGVSPL